LMVVVREGLLRWESVIWPDTTSVSLLGLALSSELLQALVRLVIISSFGLLALVAMLITFDRRNLTDVLALIIRRQHTPESIEPPVPA
jgi:hypothetical protein